MAGGAAWAHFRQTGRPVKIMRQSQKAKWFDIWEGLPWMVRPEDHRACDLLYAKDAAGLRPYIAGKTDKQWQWRAFRPEPAVFHFTAAEMALADTLQGAVVIEPWIKSGATPNKQWGWPRWQALVAAGSGIDWVQLGPAGTGLLKGARHVVTQSFRQAVAALSGARAAVLPEGALHHAAAAVSTRAVVIRGGFIGPRVTGYPGQVDFFDGGSWPLGCGMRTACPHCVLAMASIKPEQVLEALQGLLHETNRRDLAA